MFKDGMRLFYFKLIMCHRKSLVAQKNTINSLNYVSQSQLTNASEIYTPILSSTMKE